MWNGTGKKFQLRWPASKIIMWYFVALLTALRYDYYCFFFVSLCRCCRSIITFFLSCLDFVCFFLFSLSSCFFCRQSSTACESKENCKLFNIGRVCSCVCVCVLRNVWRKMYYLKTEDKILFVIWVYAVLADCIIC